MNEVDFKLRHKQLASSDLGAAMLKNPDLIWQTSDFLSKLGKRCRRCYPKVMNDIMKGQDTNQTSYWKSVLCSSCLLLYQTKLNNLNQVK